MLKVLEPIWATKPETASRVRQRIEAVLNWAKARGYRSGDNPARWRGHLDHLLPAQRKVAAVKHHSALPYPEVAAFITDLRERPGTTARALEFLILTAGADWSAATALAAASEGMSIVETGRNCTVEFAESSIAVTFIAGQGLKGAAYKGPKTRARAVVAAAAILLRRKHGVRVETTADGATTPEQPLAADFLAGASDTLKRAARIVLTGSSPIAADMLFDLAISARAEAAPRLTANLRSLARQAGLAMARNVHFDQESFPADAARVFALIEGLKRDSSNPMLTGSLRRDYRPHASLDLWMLGAWCWRNETGARGLTLYGFEPQEKRWHSASIARGAGQDPSFEAKAAYRLPFWGGNPPPTLMGGVMHLPEPLVAADHSIAPTLPKPGTVRGRFRSASELIDAGAAHVSWATLREDLAQRFGGGLQRRSQPAPALLAPTKFAGFAFDEFAQTYE